jgi:hypothetical protein
METDLTKLILPAAAILLIAGTMLSPITVTAQEQAIAVVCKTGGKMSARVRSMGPVTLLFTAAAAAAKDAEPGEGQCAYRDSAMDANSPKKIRAKTTDHGLFLVDKLLKGGTFEVQATNNGKGLLIMTSSEPAAAAAE